MHNIMKSLCSILLVFLLYHHSSCAKEVLEINIIIKNHQFIPDKIEIPSNRKIKLIVHNQDSTIEEFESHDLKREKIIPANSKKRIVLAPLKPGEYKFFGEFHEETAQGILIVKDQDV